MTAVCSTGNVELVRSLGADDVVDYTQEDFTRSGERYDLMLDVAGSRSWSEVRRVLERTGTLVIVGGPKANRLIGPLPTWSPRYVWRRCRSSRKADLLHREVQQAGHGRSCESSSKPGR